MASLMAPAVLSCGYGSPSAEMELVRNARVREVTHFGVSLDASAAPEEVAFVAFRAMRDDSFAGGAADRRAAIAVLVDTAALNLLERARRAGTTREEVLYNLIERWTPAISHYAADLPIAMEDARARFVVSPVRRDTQDKRVEVCEVYIEAADPSGVENASVVIALGLARDGGFWRILTVGFTTAARTLSGRTS